MSVFTVDDNKTHVVIADNTGVFVLLTYFKHTGLLGDRPICMEYPRGVIDINDTEERTG